MGTAVATLNGQQMQVPAHILERRKKRRADYSDVLGSAVQMNRISLDGKQFSLKLHGQIAKTHDKPYLDVAIVARSKVGRQYFKDAYNPDAQEKSGPVCYSNDGLKPEPSSPMKQCSTCKLCPKNQKGSHASGRGKACSSIMRLAVQLAGEIDEPRTYVVDCKGMSLFGKQDVESNKLNATTYFAKLRDEDLEANEVWTRIAFDKKESVAKLYFKGVGFLEPDHTEQLQIASEDPKLADQLRIGGVAPVAKVEETDEEVEEPVAAAPAKAKQIAKPAPQPTAEEEDEPAPAPKPKAKRAAAPAPEPEAVEEDEDNAPPPAKKAAPPQAKPVRQANVEDAEEVEAPKPKAKRAAPVVDDEEEAEDAAPAPKTRAVQTRALPKPVTMQELDDGLEGLVGDWKAPAAA